MCWDGLKAKPEIIQLAFLCWGGGVRILHQAHVHMLPLAAMNDGLSMHDCSCASIRVWLLLGNSLPQANSKCKTVFQKMLAKRVLVGENQQTSNKSHTSVHKRPMRCQDSQQGALLRPDCNGSRGTSKRVVSLSFPLTSQNSAMLLSLLVPLEKHGQFRRQLKGVPLSEKVTPQPPFPPSWANSYNSATENQ